MPSPRRLLSQAAFVCIALTAIGTALAPAALAGRSTAATMGAARVEYRLPFLAGQSFTVTQGWHGSYSHSGLAAYAYDFGLPERIPVVAAAAGVVAFAESGHRACGDAKLRDAANYVTIYHADGTATQYAHLSKVEVTVGQVVAGGQEIGRSGKVGFTGCQPHLHFARQAQGKAVTQSIPVYFAETGNRRLPPGASVTSANPVCSQASAGLPTGAFCGVYTTATGLGALQTTRLDRMIDVPAPPGGGLKSSAVAATINAPADAPRAGSVVAATWIGRFVFASSGMYMFTLSTDADVRLSIDGSVVAASVATGDPNAGALPEPRPEGASVWRWMPAGQHVIQVTYRSTLGVGLRFDWRETTSDGALRTDF